MEKNTGVLLSIQKEFSDLIFSGKKPMEFRNVKIKAPEGTKVYIYETKGGRIHGIGKVVGYFISGGVFDIPAHRVGTYAMIGNYMEYVASEDDRLKYGELVKKALNIKFKNTDNSYVLSYICNSKAINRMVASGKPLEPKDFTFLSHDSNEYTRLSDESDRLCNECDKWLSEIGYYDEYDECHWKYYIKIAKPIRIEPVDIKSIQLHDGRMLKMPPQSYCYIKDLL